MRIPDNRSCLKNVYWLNLCVGPEFQFLKFLQYSCGLKCDPALTLNQYPIFEIASSIVYRKNSILSSLSGDADNRLTLVIAC